MIHKIINRLSYEVLNIRPLEIQERYNVDHGTLSSLAELAPPLKTLLVSSFEETNDTTQLGALLRHHGSDKSTRHNYHIVYGNLLQDKRHEPLKILEIGLGTNNTSFKSNMGKDGVPGASLRAFRDWASHAEIYGADIDAGVLFSEERIQTYFVDQTDPASLESLSEQVGGQFDLIIDDGLHNPIANINTLSFALGLVKPGGVIVIEDIVEKFLPAWQIVAGILGKGELIKCKTEYVFIIRN